MLDTKDYIDLLLDIIEVESEALIDDLKELKGLRWYKHRQQWQMYDHQDVLDHSQDLIKTEGHQVR